MQCESCENYVSPNDDYMILESGLVYCEGCAEQVLGETDRQVVSWYEQINVLVGKIILELRDFDAEPNFGRGMLQIREEFERVRRILKFRKSNFK